MSRRVKEIKVAVTLRPFEPSPEREEAEKRVCGHLYKLAIEKLNEESLNKTD